MDIKGIQRIGDSEGGGKMLLMIGKWGEIKEYYKQKKKLKDRRE